MVNAAILRHGFLVGLEPRQKLDAAKDPFGHFARLGCGGRHDAIQAKSDGGGAGEHLEMDVAGARPFGIPDQAFEDVRRGTLRSDPAARG